MVVTLWAALARMGGIEVVFGGARLASAQVGGGGGGGVQRGCVRCRRGGGLALCCGGSICSSRTLALQRRGCGNMCGHLGVRMGSFCFRVCWQARCGIGCGKDPLDHPIRRGSEPHI